MQYLFPPLLFSLCILEFRKVTRTKVSISDLSRSTSIFVVCFLFIFAVCLLVFEQYLVKWEYSLGAKALQEIIISARYPAEISFLILFYWKDFFFFFNSILLTRFCVPTLYETPWATPPPPLIGYDQNVGNWLLAALVIPGGRVVQVFLLLSNSHLQHQAQNSLCWHILNDTSLSFYYTLIFTPEVEAQLARCPSCIRH